jgi:hypothetical protein
VSCHDKIYILCYLKVCVFVMSAVAAIAQSCHAILRTLLHHNVCFAMLYTCNITTLQCHNIIYSSLVYVLKIIPIPYLSLLIMIKTF